MSDINCLEIAVVFTLPVFNILARSFFYGTYVVLFCICTYILKHRRKGPRTVFIVTATALFLLSTAQAAIYTMLDLRDIIDQFLGCGVYNWNGVCTPTLIHLVKSDPTLELALMYVATSAIADGLLIYRCYVVWGNRKRIIAAPVLLLLGSTGCGIASAILQGFIGANSSYLAWGTSARIYDPYFNPRNTFIVSAVTNAVVTSSTAGRIWWISRQARFILGRNVTQKYSTTIAIIVESGLIYTILVMAYLIVTQWKSASSVPYASLTQIVGIVPTLMIVRVGLGASVDSVEASVTAARSDHRLRLGLEHVETDVLRSPVEMSIIDIRRQRRNTAVPLNGALGSVDGVSVEEVSK